MARRIVILILFAMVVAQPAQATTPYSAPPPATCLPAEQLRLSARLVSSRALDVEVTNTVPVTATAATLAVWAMSGAERVYSDTVDVPALEPGASFTFRAETGVYLPAGPVRAWWQWWPHGEPVAGCPARYVTYWRGWLPVLREMALVDLGER